MTDSPALLSHRLRNETKEAHTAAERSGIMRDVLRGTVSRDQYLALLVNLRALYGALETQLERNRNHPSLASVDWRSLARRSSLDADILAFAGTTASDALVAPSTAIYVSHLNTLGEQHPEQLFPHAYLRYLGDLYGGQIMRGILQKTFADVPDGFSFYSFDDIANVSDFKSSFRSAIDVLPKLGYSSDVMVGEAARGYELHSAIFKEIVA